MNDITRKVLSGMSGDGFNERKNYIDVSNDMNKKKDNNFDNSLAKQRIEENKPNVSTLDTVKNKIDDKDNVSDVSKLKSNVDMYQSFRRKTTNFPNKFK